MVSSFGTYLNAMSMTSPAMSNGMNYYNSGIGFQNVNFKGSDDYNSYMSALQSDRTVSMSSQQGTRIGDKVTKLANSLRTALYDGNERQVKETLELMQNDPQTLASVEVAYGKMEGKATALRDDIRMSLNDWSTKWPVLSDVCNFFRNTVGKLWNATAMSETDAIDILNKGATVSTQVAANALKNALNQGVIFKDKDTINTILGGSKQRVNEIMNLYDGDLVNDIESQYSWIIDGPNAASSLVNKVTEGLYA